jgi:RNA polymerase sigma-70 factor (ECF subfamily)
MQHRQPIPGHDAGIAKCIALARAGSREALGRLLDWCRPYLLLVSNRELDSDLYAKAGPSDVVQQTFLEAQQDFADFRGTSEADLLAWLRGILRHNLASLHRHYHGTAMRCYDREIPLDYAAEEGLVSPSASPCGKAVAHEQLEALEQALARLPDDYRQTIELHHHQGRTFAEIGVLLDRSAEAARKLWARAIDRLQQELGDRA